MNYSWMLRGLNRLKNPQLDQSTIYRYYWIITSIVKSTTLDEYKMNCKILDTKDIKLLLLKVNQGLI
jgi:hypothetical protein